MLLRFIYDLFNVIVCLFAFCPNGIIIVVHINDVAMRFFVMLMSSACLLVDVVMGVAMVMCCHVDSVCLPVWWRCC